MLLSAAPVGTPARPDQNMLLGGTDTGEAVALATLNLPPHGAAPEAEAYACHATGCYVLRGTLVATVGERTIILHAGETVYVGPGVSHAYWNPTAAPVEALLIFTPATAERIENHMIEGS